MEFKDILSERVKEIEAILLKYLPEEEGYAKSLLQAMNYSLLAGGKRLRPMLLQECYRMFGGQAGPEEPFMAAIEMIHTYSLVHDDLPAMDNDAYRRGRLTTWKQYGEDVGILAGDGLLNLAYETGLAAIVGSESADVSCRGAKALSILGKKAGCFGMVGGQMADLEAEGAGGQVSEEHLLYIHEHKTACLIQAAMMMGAVLAGAPQEQVESLERCAYDVGIAFQIQDDILDIEGSMEELGKPIGSDEENEKTTYVTLHGMQASKEEVKRLSDEAQQILMDIPGDHAFLDALIASLVDRRK